MTQVSKARPEIKIMLMSGFEGGYASVERGMAFPHKPFVPSQMTGVIQNIVAQPAVPNLDERKP